MNDPIPLLETTSRGPKPSTWRHIHMLYIDEWWRVLHESPLNRFPSSLASWIAAWVMLSDHHAPSWIKHESWWSPWPVNFIYLATWGSLQECIARLRKEKVEEKGLSVEMRKTKFIVSGLESMKKRVQSIPLRVKYAFMKNTVGSNCRLMAGTILDMPQMFWCAMPNSWVK